MFAPCGDVLTIPLSVGMPVTPSCGRLPCIGICGLLLLVVPVAVLANASAPSSGAR